MSVRLSLNLPGYDVRGRIGRGAGALISEGLEKATGRQVAIKHIVRQNAADEKFFAQAENEYEVARRFEHPLLRRCYDIFRVRKWLKTQELILIMEFVDGTPLEEHPPEQLDQSIAVFIKIAQGLHALHGYGFAHADIKPNNVLITPGMGVKIIDFGQSCPLGHIKERIQGTPDFMAPEQVERKKIDHRTDVFNLGATMYWALTGKHFKTMINTAPTGAKQIDVDSKRGNDPPHEVNPRIPLALSKLITDCCSYGREARPADMREVVSRLEVVQHVISLREREMRGGRRGGRGEKSSPNPDPRNSRSA